METKIPIYYENDFIIDVALSMDDGNAIPNNVGFSANICAGGRIYKASYIDGKRKNCEVRFDDSGFYDRVFLVCKKHGLGPGIIFVEFTWYLPNDLFNDGMEDIYTEVETDYQLESVQRQSTMGNVISAQVAASFISENHLIYGTLDKFPRPGRDKTLYIDTQNNMQYIWKDDDYHCVGSDWNDIQIVDGNIDE